MSSASAALRLPSTPFRAGSSTISATVSKGSACRLRKSAPGLAHRLQRIARRLGLARLLVADGHRLGGEAPGKRARRHRPATAAVPAVGVWAISPAAASARPGAGSYRTLLPELGKTQQLVGRHAQRLAHLVNEREARLDLGALVARVAVLLDAQRLGEIARAIEPALGAHGLQAFRKLRTHFGREHRGHCTRGFADCTQKVIAKNGIFADKTKLKSAVL